MSPEHVWVSSYLQYSSICARLLRRALKPEHRDSALFREESLLKVSRWKNGQPEPAGKLHYHYGVTPVFFLSRVTDSESPVTCHKSSSSYVYATSSNILLITVYHVKAVRKADCNCTCHWKKNE